MKTDLKSILKPTFEREGNYGNVPADPGGETYKGISRVVWLAWDGWKVIDAHKSDYDFPKCLEALEHLQKLVVDFYEQNFWEPSRAAEMPGYLRELYFDMCVNHGQENAVLIIQHACRHKGIDIDDDGDIGRNTLNAAPHLERNDVVLQRLLFYTDIQLKHPSQRKFARGWYRHRCINFIN